MIAPPYGFQTAVSPDSVRADIAPNELPPPYSALGPGGAGVPMVTCRVCQNMIDISEKRAQHVAKCNSCNEATVSLHILNLSIYSGFRLFWRNFEKQKPINVYIV